MDEAKAGAEPRQPLQITVRIDLDYDELIAIVRLVGAVLSDDRDEGGRPEEDAKNAYLTIEEAADLARCSSKTIHRAVKSGGVPAFRVGRRLLMRGGDVRAWIESQPAGGKSLGIPKPSRPRRSGRKPEPGSPGSIESLREIERQLTER